MTVPQSSTTKGNALEQCIFDLIKREIEADRFYFRKEICKVFLKKGYYSKDRGKEIIFDVAVEVNLEGSTKYSTLVLVECKNYKTSVPVDDVEEFFAKVQQVAPANAKAVIASTASFQQGARQYAESKGIGLMRYFSPEKFKWVLYRSPLAAAGSTPSEDAELVANALAQEDFRSLVFDLYLRSPARHTNSLWDFFEDLALDSGLTPEQLQSISNPRSKVNNQVRYREKTELETLAGDLLLANDYAGGEVDLGFLCVRESERTGLRVETGIPSPSPDDTIPLLGRIAFDPLVIQVYTNASANRGRDRFTLAHELAHYFLDHGDYLIRESCDENDFAPNRSFAIAGNDVARMEYQANFLAASLLMPQTYFTEDFHRLVRSLDLPDRGYGPLYVDEQPCNLDNFLRVTQRLMEKYGVSRSATRIRLESLGLLIDTRGRNGLQPIQSIFSELR